ncbi:hypothetical protein WAI453_000606 [Rhynchosporium graminicola]
MSDTTFSVEQLDALLAGNDPFADLGFHILDQLNNEPMLIASQESSTSIKQGNIMTD